MGNKVILILVDGMRPDSLSACGHPCPEQLKREGVWSLKGETVFPSVTLPCHMSLFHSVTPERHGVTTNTFVPQVRPIDGICERVAKSEGKNAFFYNWAELRDLAQPASMAFSFMASEGILDPDETNRMVEEQAIRFLRHTPVEFAFIYLGAVDAHGHNHGWMTPRYLQGVYDSWDSIARIIAALGDEYHILITADHGGHDRAHGTTLPEDMLIPFFAQGPAFEPGRELSRLSILDIAPTVADLLNIHPAREWEGHSLLTKQP